MSFVDAIDNAFDNGRNVQRSSSADYRFHPYTHSQRRNDYEHPAAAGAPYQQQLQTPARGSMGGVPQSWSPDPQERQQQQLPPFGRLQQGFSEGPGHSIPPVDIEILASALKLDSAARSSLHDFNELSSPAQLVALFAHVLDIRQSQVVVAEQLDQFGGNVEQLQKLQVATFKPTAQSIKHMRRMTRHFVIQPLQNYLQLHGATQNYYMRKPSTFKIDSYATDLGVRDTVNTLLVKFAGQTRANYRKLIWKFVAQGVALDVWADFIMRHYHYHGSGKAPEASNMIKARIALMRQVALPLVALPTVKGQNTSFWDKMRLKLLELYQKHGQDLKSEAWVAWAKEIVKADTDKYTVEVADLSDEDADLPAEGSGGNVAGSAADDAPGTSGAAGQSDADSLDPVED